MEELNILRQFIEQGRYDEALLFIDELEEMSKEDKLNKIFSYVLVLLIHLIKKAAEQRTTRSWEVSISHAVHQIRRTNTRRKSGGVYAQREELAEILEEAFDLALKKASLEVFGGKLDDLELATKINRVGIIQEALQLMSAGGVESR
jgi:hypothetical protein